MTDAGDISNEEFAQIWQRMSNAEKQADVMEQRLDAIHEQLDTLLESLEPYHAVSQEQEPHLETASESQKGPESSRDNNNTKDD